MSKHRTVSSEVSNMRCPLSEEEIRNVVELMIERRQFDHSRIIMLQRALVDSGIDRQNVCFTLSGSGVDSSYEKFCKSIEPTILELCPSTPIDVAQSIQLFVSEHTSPSSCGSLPIRFLLPIHRNHLHTDTWIVLGDLHMDYIKKRWGKWWRHGSRSYGRWNLTVTCTLIDLGWNCDTQTVTYNHNDRTLINFQYEETFKSKEINTE